MFHSTEYEEDYKPLDNLMKLIKYTEHNWKICCDLKVVRLLCGLKGGRPNYPCFSCNWHSRSDGWESQKQPGQNPEIGIMHTCQVEVNDVLIPPLHIKLGLVQKFLEVVLKSNTKAFDCLKNGQFKKRTNDKIYAGMYTFISFQ